MVGWSVFDPRVAVIARVLGSHLAGCGLPAIAVSSTPERTLGSAAHVSSSTETTARPFAPHPRHLTRCLRSSTLARAVEPEPQQEVRCQQCAVMAGGAIDPDEITTPEILDPCQVKGRRRGCQAAVDLSRSLSVARNGHPTRPGLPAGLS